MVWDNEAKAKLAACTTDDQLRDTFPGIKLENLWRRRREFASVGDSRTTRSRNLGRIEEILENAGYDKEDVGKIGRIRFSEWDQGGETLHSTQVVFSPSWDDGPEWPVVQQADPVKLNYVSGEDRRESRFKVAVILPDPQFGYRRDMITERLDPFHDPDAIDVALQITKDLRPDKIVNLGDVLDFAEFGKYTQEPAFARTSQAAINSAYRYLAYQRDIGPFATIDYLEGNHDRRIQNSIIDNAKAAFGLQQACLPNSWPVNSVPHLLRLDSLDVNYTSGYPANITWINDRVACIHGSKVRSSGSTAAAVIDDERVSVVFGHIHRIEQIHKTRRVRNGHKTNFAASPGCLCKIDGTVPGVKGSTDAFGRAIQTAENWQQGIAVVSYEEGDGPFSLELIPIHSGTAIFRGNEYRSTREYEVGYVR